MQASCCGTQGLVLIQWWVFFCFLERKLKGTVISSQIIALKFCLAKFETRIGSKYFAVCKGLKAVLSSPDFHLSFCKRQSLTPNSFGRRFVRLLGCGSVMDLLVATELQRISFSGSIDAIRIHWS
jgi:hypothetical protein